jgi:hypothetical protein
VNHGNPERLCECLRTFFVLVARRNKIEPVDPLDCLDVIARNPAAADKRDSEGLRRVAHQPLIRSMEFPCDLYFSPQALQVPSPLSGNLIPHLHIHPIRRPGTPPRDRSPEHPSSQRFLRR